MVPNQEASLYLPDVTRNIFQSCPAGCLRCSLPGPQKVSKAPWKALEAYFCFFPKTRSALPGVDASPTCICNYLQLSVSARVLGSLMDAKDKLYCVFINIKFWGSSWNRPRFLLDCGLFKKTTHWSLPPFLIFQVTFKLHCC